MAIGRTLFALIALAWVSSLRAQEALPNEVLVGVAPGSDLAMPAAFLRWGMTQTDVIPQLGVRRVKLPPGSNVAQARAALGGYPFVRFVEPNYLVRPAYVPNDPSFGNQWALSKIRMAQSWDVTFGSASTVIAIIDSGIDKAHPDLVGKYVAGWDFINNDSDAQDDNGHGTYCAGIAAAATDNGIGVAGVGFNCKIMPIKVLNSVGAGSTADVAHGITYAVDNGAKVLSISLVASGGSSTLLSAVDYAYANDVSLVAASGNSGNSTPLYPAYYANSIAVAATDSSDQRASFSNFGTWVDVAAPGANILCTVLGGTYGLKSGTSMAAPHVAGLLGLLWTHYGSTSTADFIRDRLESTCDDVGTFVSKGRINGERALTDPLQKHFAPTSFSMQAGTSAGDVSFLSHSDDQRVVMRTVRSNRTNYLRWIAEFDTGASEALAGMKVTYEAFGTLTPSLAVYAWDYQASAWVLFGTVKLSGSDTTTIWNSSGSGSSFQDANGRFKLMFSYAKPARQGVQITSDFLRLTKVLAN